MRSYVIGVDVGATSAKLGLINRKGAVVSRSTVDTTSYKRAKSGLINAWVKAIVQLIQKSNLKRSDIAGVGFGLPGLVNPIKGVVKILPNIPGWNNVSLRRILYSKLRIPVYLDNDVNLITLAEWKYGAGKNYNDLICVTFGTGVGGGLVFNNQLYRGEGFAAGEVGHMPLNEKGPKNTFGGWASFESYVGHRQLASLASRITGRKNVTLPQVRQLTRNGHKKAEKFWEAAGTKIGNGLVGIVNLLNPPLIIFGGGVAYSYPYLVPYIRKVIKQRCMPVQGKMVKITRAKLGNDAGIIGARVLVNDEA